ncbi:hypothetical protein [Streptomyces sp.]|uniref:hypothetical protein n=1 Tax=Streptomyces sp. TaxID=1931 RepID=UPI002D66D766|nr:hypothetical protein [Streptomyces sp.]HZF92016.1 hypothetical protein [Streptomyces sp.]
MPTAKAITYDREPGFIADVLEIDGASVCVVNPAALKDAGTRSLVRQVAQGRGLDCGTCRGCLVGTTVQDGGGGTVTAE